MLTTIILSFIILKIIYEIKSSYFGEIGQRSIAIPVEKRGVEKKEPVVVIVGAGAAGLAVGAVLKEKGIPFVIFESASESGYVWRNRYNRLHLHTTRDCSGLPFLPMPKHFPVYPTKNQVADYLDAYAKLLGPDSIRYNHLVKDANFDEGSKTWTVKAENLITKQSTSLTTRFLVVGSGENSIPKVPKFEGQDSFKGKVIHSIEYKSGAQFKGENVLVVGYGNSGGEISLDLWENGAKPTVLIRSPINILSRSILRILEDVLDPYLKIGSLPLAASKGLPTFFNKLMYSDLAKFNIITPHPKDDSIDKMQESHNPPVIDLGQIDLIRQQQVQVVSSEISHFTSDSVVFKNGNQISFDSVILCTGFQKAATFSQFLSEKTLKQSLNSKGVAAKLSIPDLSLFFNGYRDRIGRFRQMRLDAFEIGKEIERQMSNK